MNLPFSMGTGTGGVEFYHWDTGILLPDYVGPFYYQDRIMYTWIENGEQAFSVYPK